MQPYLPPELVSHILSFLEPSDPLSVPTLLAASTVSTSFRPLALSPGLWTLLAESRWHSGTTRTTEDPYAFYKARHALDGRASKLVEQMTTVTRNRLQLITEAREIGLDVQERLDREVKTMAEMDPEHWLSRRYYAREALQAILRDDALKTWQRIAAEDEGGSQESENSFEEGVIAFAEHRGADPAAVRELHRRTAAKIDRALASMVTNPDEHSSRSPSDRKKWLSQVVRSVADFMSESGLKPADGDNFQRLENHFLDSVWLDSLSSTNTGTLPMSLVAIFCSLVNRLDRDLNVQARPIGFPGTMLAAIAHRDEAAGSEDWVFVNVYAGCRILSPVEMRTMLEALGDHTPLDSDIRRPASAGQMCRRVAINIITSIRHAAGADAGDSAEAVTASLYAAATALFVFVPFAQRRLYAGWITSLCQSEFEVDVAFLETEVVPALGAEGEDAKALCKSIRMEDATGPESTKLRTARIVWRVGHIFRHRLFGYNAVIRGWDLTCEASEEWIIQMRVDTLPYGRHQPFYHVIVEDGSDRYVASENVTDGLVDASTCEVFAEMHSIGKHFRKVGVDGRGRPKFVKSAALEVEYPDD